MAPTNRGLVQPIIVIPGTHWDTITAVALASVTALYEGTHTDTDDTSAAQWLTWLHTGFTKSVRKVKNVNQLSKVVKVMVELGYEPRYYTVRERHQADSAQAVAFMPLSYDDFPKELSRLQVSGLDCVRERDTHEYKGFLAPRTVPEISLLDSMTTGKAAAQAAHALGLWSTLQTDSAIETWLGDPHLVLNVVQDIVENDQTSIYVRDRGHTEVEPGTITARLSTPRGVGL